jgi:hypothetical protein
MRKQRCTGGENKGRINVALHKARHARLLDYCLDHGLKLTDAVDWAVRDFLRARRIEDEEREEERGGAVVWPKIPRGPARSKKDTDRPFAKGGG